MIRSDWVVVVFLFDIAGKRGQRPWLNSRVSHVLQILGSTPVEKLLLQMFGGGGWSPCHSDILEHMYIHIIVIDLALAGEAQWIEHGLQTKGSPVQFPVRAHARIAGQVPSTARLRGKYT